MKQEIIHRYYSKYLLLVIIGFSLISTILSMVSINFDNFDKIFTTSIFQYTLFVINILCILLLVKINIKSLEKSSKRNFTILGIIYFSLLINIVISFDFYFIKSDLIQTYSVLNVLNILPIYPIFLIVYEYEIFKKLPARVSIGIVLFFIILVNNIAFTLLFKFVKYKNENKYIILTLYYFQNNSLSIIILLLTYLGSWA
jgi:hypothetical protein